MAITIPSGPAQLALHALRSATDQGLKVGASVPIESGNAPEAEVHLLIPAAQEAPDGWTEFLHEPPCHTVNFTNVADAGKFCDAAEFSVSTTRGESYHAWSKARFFAAFQQLDDHDAPDYLPPLTLDERHRAATYAAAAGAVGIDAIVTTAGRTDVADNDVVVSMTPDAAVPLIGHYLQGD